MAVDLNRFFTGVRVPPSPEHEADILKIKIKIGIRNRE